MQRNVTAPAKLIKREEKKKKESTRHAPSLDQEKKIDFNTKSVKFSFSPQLFLL